MEVLKWNKWLIIIRRRRKRRRDFLGIFSEKILTSTNDVHFFAFLEEWKVSSCGQAQTIPNFAQMQKDDQKEYLVAGFLKVSF